MIILYNSQNEKLYNLYQNPLESQKKKPLYFDYLKPYDQYRKIIFKVNKIGEVDQDLTN